MSKHTPGPWHIEEEIYGLDICAGEYVMAGIDEPLTDIDRANAMLIAAAPELYAELEAIARDAGLEAGACSAANDTRGVRVWSELQARVSAALRKAQGVTDREYCAGMKEVAK
jgi:hypothetical protein